MKNPIYTIAKVSIELNEKVALDIRKVDIHRGSCYVIHGDIGSGKTTFLNLLSKQQRVANGHVYYDGSDINSISTGNLLKEICHISQRIKDPWFNTSVENFIKKRISSHKSISEPLKRYKDIVRNMKIKSFLNRNYKDLSDGEKRWISLAANIACDTKVLIIDGFGQCLSEDKIHLLSKILYRKINYDGATVIVGTHVKEKLNRIASVYIKLDKGKIVGVRSKSKHSNAKGSHTKRPQSKYKKNK